ncbi:MAG: hypothetical protein GW808_11790, partial [Sphingomonadales bacterium]|nr:hypothetical protein [Sphingomonadales bacterium]
CLAALEDYRSIVQRYYPEPVSEMEDWKKRAYLTLRYGVMQREAQVAWTEEAERIICDVR